MKNLIIKVSTGCLLALMTPLALPSVFAQDAAPAEETVTAEEPSAESPAINADKPPVIYYTTADVLQVKVEGEGSNATQTVRLHITENSNSGDAAGKDLTILTPISGKGGISLEQGDFVSVKVEKSSSGEFSGIILEHSHSGIWFAVIISILVLLFIGRRDGLIATAVTTGSILTVFFLTAPLILRGLSPLWAALVTTLFIAGILSIIVFGWSKSAAAAAISSCISILFTMLIGFAYLSMANLGKINSPLINEIVDLPGLRLENLTIAIIMLAALGAITHVAFRITAMIFLEKRQHPDRDLRTLLDVGMTNGRRLLPVTAESALWVLFGLGLPMLLLAGTRVSVFRAFVFSDVVLLLALLLTMITSVALTVPIVTITSSILATKDLR